MKIKIYEDRKVYQEKKIIGINNENKVETLEFEYPQKYKDFTKILEMKEGEWKAIDEIIDDKYVIKNNVSNHQFVSMQVVFKDEINNVVFKSEMFEVQFLDAINATDEIEEENKDVIETLVDEKFEEIEHEFDDKYVEKEEGKVLSTNDFDDTYKQNVDDNTNARHTHNNKSVLDNITSTDINNWNNKSNFSGSYNDLTDKPTIPSKTSDLDNDSGFITNTVNNLINYYTKSENYTKEEVNNLIGSISTLNLQIVQTLPTQDISTNTIYLVPKSTAGTNDYYDEYIYANNNWELIGNTSIDISGKEDKSNKTTAITDQSTDAQYPSAKAVYDALAGAGGVDYIFQWDGIDSRINTDNLTLWNDIYTKQKTTDCIVLNSKKSDIIYIPKNSMGIAQGSYFLYGLKKTADTGVDSSAQTNSFFSVTTNCYTYYIYQGAISVCYDWNGSVVKINCLSPNTNYSTVYTPQYDGSPVPKKYVDDLVGDINTLLGGI